MRIPPQSHGSHDAPGVRADDVVGLRARRRGLVGELRRVAYWQRLVQARTDLCVAGLLYASPTPAAPALGLDLDRVLGDHATCESTGAHLDRLRETGLALAHRGRALQEELDVLTVALRAHLVGDGAGAVTRTAGVGNGARSPHPA